VSRAVVDDTERTDQRVVLVRHAQTAWTLSGQHTGTTDLPLTDEGAHGTRLLRQRLGRERFARVFTSPLQRAAETCRIAGFSDVAQIRTDLVEWDYGKYEGRTTADIRSSDPAWDLWGEGAPDGESPADMTRRVDRVLDELLDLCASGGDVLVFGHGHSLTALTIRWLGLPIDNGRHLRLGTGSVSTLGWKRDVRVLETWNDRHHLEDV
jgi:probable phosphoglycerate mutase